MSINPTDLLFYGEQPASLAGLSPNLRLAIVITHPIQYHIPWLKELSKKNMSVKVFYTWSQSENGAIYDQGFSRNIKWDIPMLEGYEYTFVKNVSKKPGTHRFFGIVNPSLNEEIEEWKPDYLMVYGWNFHSHLNCLLYFHKKIPILFVGDSTLLNERNGLRKLARRIFLRWVYRHIDIACYAGKHNKNYFIRHGIKKENLAYIPHSVDIGHFSSNASYFEERGKEWRADLGIPENHLVVLYAGKLIEVKNPEFLIDLAKACTDLPVTVLIVGNGALEDKLKQSADGLRNVEFLGFKNQQLMPIIYRMGDVLVLPSINETWGLCVSEAMACEKPVMVSKNVGCAIDMVEENKNGISFRLDELDKCVSFLKKISQNKDLARQMGLNARNKIDAFSVDEKVNKICALISSMEHKKSKIKITVTS